MQSKRALAVSLKKDLVHFGASGEQCFLTERGVKAVICGPGSLAQAHTIDEFTTEEQVRKAQEFYEALLKKVFNQT